MAKILSKTHLQNFQSQVFLAGIDVFSIEQWEKFTNYEEYLNGTDPNNNDTDGDGMPDGWEGYYGLNPRSADDRDWDSDADGYDSDRDG